MTKTRCALMWGLALFMMGAGLAHFVNPAFFVALVPPFLPWPEALVYASGVAEIGFGLMLLVPRTRRLGAWGIIATLLAVYPANIHHAVSGGLHGPGLPPAMGNAAVAWARLPFQLVFLYWAWIFARRPR